jgi:hypothetical protein
MDKVKRASQFIICLMLAVSVCFASWVFAGGDGADQYGNIGITLTDWTFPPQPEGVSIQEVKENIGNGWNLGNQFDSYGPLWEDIENTHNAAATTAANAAADDEFGPSSVTALPIDISFRCAAYRDATSSSDPYYSGFTYAQMSFTGNTQQALDDWIANKFNPLLAQVQAEGDEDMIELLTNFPHYVNYVIYKNYKTQAGITTEKEIAAINALVGGKITWLGVNYGDAAFPPLSYFGENANGVTSWKNYIENLIGNDEWALISFRVSLADFIIATGGGEVDPVRLAFINERIGAYLLTAFNNEISTRNWTSFYTQRLGFGNITYMVGYIDSANLDTWRPQNWQTMTKESWEKDIDWFFTWVPWEDISLYDAPSWASLLNQWNIEGYNTVWGETLTREKYIKYRLYYENVFRFETEWENPPATLALIQGVKAAGFDSVRIPVTWLEHLGQGDSIDPLWLARIYEVVGWVIDEEMTCVINIHHDGAYDGYGDTQYIGWLSVNRQTKYEATQFSGSGIGTTTFTPNQEEVDRFAASLVRFENLWTQIATEFADFDEHLLFEGMNEVSGNFYHDRFTLYHWATHEEEWFYEDASTPPEEKFTALEKERILAVLDYCIENINTLNQLFVDTVRDIAGNGERFLFCPTLFSSQEIRSIARYKLPDDDIGGSDKIFVKINMYPCTEFSMANSATTKTEAGNTNYDFDWQWWTSTNWTEFSSPQIMLDLSFNAVRGLMLADSFDSIPFMTDNFINWGDITAGKGWNVVICEWGTTNMKNILSPTQFTQRQSGRASYSAFFRELAADCDIVWFLWDDGGENSFGGLINRTDGTIITTGQNVVNAIVGK